MQHHIVITENLTPIYLTQKIHIDMEKIEHLKVGAILFWIPFGLKTKSRNRHLKSYDSQKRRISQRIIYYGMDDYAERKTQIEYAVWGKIK